MRLSKCLSLQNAKQRLRKDSRCSVVNGSGYCVFMDAKGESYYIVDEDMLPVTFNSFNILIKQPLKHFQYSYQYQ